ncbi:branched-chain amino acid transporter [Bifidobacterium gallicum DSM 20093 = LMG 11596]|uniref:Branched-chain amino acid transporter n=1 Tax=Bifidobacterium gallicum DSM 20093 = LMG 11596 TaxID=561180 RepID=A0A087AEN7_9BIFI|nr:branched-chain amino acid transport system II carrier protein [Bifidobacterium gallicum]KFI57237.1 branched-chain amino acid transporter [Bifidobacterium gallicum DSM 20093 = LMG 11596]
MLVGVTLFSMMFGAGNLIFPPLVGALAGTASVAALIGFIISAVGLPIMGVLAVSFAGGFEQLANRVSPRFATVLAVAIILTIGPLFAIPRTASTSYEMAIAPFESAGSHWALQLGYSIVFFTLAWLVAQHPEKLSKILGRIMGPILLAMIVVLFVMCLFLPHPPVATPQGAYAHTQLMQGFVDGYQTLDLLALLYFGIVISANIRAFGITQEQRVRREVGIGGLVTGIMLVAVYSMLGFIGTISDSITPIDAQHATGADVLSNLTDHAFGRAGTVFVGIIFIIACFNVCVGLISTASSFFSGRFPTVCGRSVSYRAWSVVFTFMALAIANLGLEQIIRFSVPVLEALYPIAIVLVILALLDEPFTSRFRPVYVWSVACTCVVSILQCIAGFAQALGGRIGWIESLLAWLPLQSLTLGWVLPALVGVCIGVIVQFVHGSGRP